MAIKDKEHDTLEEINFKELTRKIQDKFVSKDKEFEEEKKNKLKEELQEEYLSINNDKLFDEII